jgi:hypothetical protein
VSEKSLKERFQEKLDGSRWTGSTNNIGYPKMKVDGEMVLGSHVALRLAGRKVPTGGPAGGKIVMHKDNNKLNLSPSNLTVGTHKENLKQMRDEGRDRPRGVRQEPDEKAASTDIDILKFASQYKSADAEHSDASSVVAPSAALGLSGVALSRSGDSALDALGYQRIHHGTSRNAGKNIREHGLDPSFGGGAMGASSAVNNKHFVRESTGKVHVTPSKPTAAAFSRLAQMQADAKAQGREMPRNAQLHMFNPLSPKGDVVSGAMPYSKFLSTFEVDPDTRGVGFRSTHKVDPSVFRTGILGAARDRMKNPRGLVRYITEHPGRFARGAAGVLLPAAAVAGSGLWLKHNVIDHAEAGNKIAFKLQGHTEHQKIQIAIENRKGSVRKGTDKDGKPWRTVMKMPYGFVKGTKGADGEEIDCYVGPHKDAPNAYVVHQRKSDGTGYDEDKILFGHANKKDAVAAYLQHYNSDKFLGPVKEVPVERLKEMLSTGKKLEKISTSLCARVLRRG